MRVNLKHGHISPAREALLKQAGGYGSALKLYLRAYGFREVFSDPSGAVMAGPSESGIPGNGSWFVLGDNGGEFTWKKINDNRVWPSVAFACSGQIISPYRVAQAMMSLYRNGPGAQTFQHEDIDDHWDEFVNPRTR